MMSAPVRPSPGGTFLEPLSRKHLLLQTPEPEGPVRRFLSWADHAVGMVGSHEVHAVDVAVVGANPVLGAACLLSAVRMGLTAAFCPSPAPADAWPYASAADPVLRDRFASLLVGVPQNRQPRLDPRPSADTAEAFSREFVMLALARLPVDGSVARLPEDLAVRLAPIAAGGERLLHVFPSRLQDGVEDSRERPGSALAALLAGLPPLRFSPGRRRILGLPFPEDKAMGLVARAVVFTSATFGADLPGDGGVLRLGTARDRYHEDPVARIAFDIARAAALEEHVL